MLFCNHYATFSVFLPISYLKSSTLSKLDNICFPFTVSFQNPKPQPPALPSMSTIKQGRQEGFHTQIWLSHAIL